MGEGGRHDDEDAEAHHEPDEQLDEVVVHGGFLLFLSKGSSGGPVRAARALFRGCWVSLILPCGLGFGGNGFEAGLFGPFDLDDPTIVDGEQDLAVAKSAQLFLDHFDPVMSRGWHIRLE